jgi:hypothetical protein
MAKEIDFKALRASVVVSSESDSRWNFQEEKAGREPPDQFSLRGDLVSECSGKLYKLQESLGVPPRDLVFKVIEEWSSAG